MESIFMMMKNFFFAQLWEIYMRVVGGFAREIIIILWQQ
jgi:hypothetical protein